MNVRKASHSALLKVHHSGRGDRTCASPPSPPSVGVGLPLQQEEPLPHTLPQPHCHPSQALAQTLLSWAGTGVESKVVTSHYPNSSQTHSRCHSQSQEKEADRLEEATVPGVAAEEAVALEVGAADVAVALEVVAWLEVVAAEVEAPTAVCMD